MNIFIAGIRWVLDPAHYGGINGIDTRTVQHLVITLVSLATSAAIAIPLGYLVGHTGRGRALAVAVSGGVRALPTLGFLILIALGVGVGFEAPYVALVVLGIPSILAGAYSGFEAIDRRTIDAARAVGMTEWQIVGKVEIPLGLPLLMGGLRLAALQIVATATLADYVGAGGLGHFIFLGLQTSDYPQMLAGSLVVIVLAIISEILFSILQKLVVPAGVAGGRLNDVRVKSSRSRAALG
ncbi:MAG: osmoprotectant transport system permease protein [Microbacteriaceae bacterium]|nr:osmoprotectant transport system permease protein [Microbacteriaceae bacterium]